MNAHTWRSFQADLFDFNNNANLFDIHSDKVSLVFISIKEKSILLTHLLPCVRKILLSQ